MATAKKKKSAPAKKAAAKKTPSTAKKATASARKTSKSTKKAAATKKKAAAPAKKAAASKKGAPAKKAAAPATKTTSTKSAAAPAKKAAAKRGAPLDKFQEAQRKLLLEEREAYTRSATALRAEADQLALDRDPGDVQFDEESGQGDSMNVERERDLALSAQALAAVEDIDRALAKFDLGTYGVCEKCGENIPKERLRALPHAALCVRCKSGGLSSRRS